MSLSVSIYLVLKLTKNGDELKRIWKTQQKVFKNCMFWNTPQNFMENTRTFQITIHSTLERLCEQYAYRFEVVQRLDHHLILMHKSTKNTRNLYISEHFEYFSTHIVLQITHDNPRLMLWANTYARTESGKDWNVFDAYCRVNSFG